MEPSQTDKEPVPPDAPHILVVDDDEAIRKLIAGVFRQAGDYRVRTARDGVEAQQVLAAEAVDLAIVDLAMPRLDGLGLMQWGREAGVDAAWVILSGQGTFDDAAKAVRLGAFDFITKPLVSTEALVVTARNALERRRLAAERAALVRDVEERNRRLSEQVEELEEACRLLTRQQETIDEDLHRAERIQRALLPTDPPDLAGFAIDAVYRPSRLVGGDVYDVVPIDERFAVLYVADAAGHGVSAAMLAVLFKHRIGMTDGRTHTPVAPATVLDRINAHVRHECRAPSLFLTAAYGLLDLRTRRLTIASAGHPPLLILRAEGEAERVYHTGPALGLSGEATFGQKTIDLRVGDRVLLYTDGLHDAAGGEGPPDDRIAEAIEAIEGDGWEVLHELLDLAAARRGEQGPQDDVTALLLTAGATASSIDNGQPARTGSEAPSLPAGAEARIGREDDTTYISVSGRGTWVHCAAFHEACRAVLDCAEPLTLDLSLCEYLDSTFLGTLQELADRAEQLGTPLHVQGMLPTVRHLLEELGMQHVLRHVATDCRPLPARMAPLDARPTDEDARRRMLRAHQVLSSLSPGNRQAFARLIEHLESQVHATDAPPE